MDSFIIVDIDAAPRALLRELFGENPLPGLWGAKIGDDVIRHGLRDIRSQLMNNTKIFIDLKHYDTPDRLKRQVAMYAELGEFAPTFLTISGDVICEGNIAALRSAVSERNNINIIVTGALSSWDDKFCSTKYSMNASAYTQHILNAVCEAEAQGITCPAWVLEEDEVLREDIQEAQSIEDFFVIGTGIRSAGVSKGNHVRPRPLACAIRFGATHGVVGSEITGVSPQEARERLLAMHRSVTSLPPGSFVDKKV